MDLSGKIFSVDYNYYGLATRTTYIWKNPARKSITQTADIWTCSSHTQPYATTEGGKNNIGTNVLRRRI